MLDLLKKKFDHIFVLSLVDRKDRQQSIISQFHNGIGIPAPDETDFIRWYYAVRFKHNGLIADAFNKTGAGKFTKPNEYDCAKNHYNMVKICYELGYEHCLFIEDDALFIRNNALIETYLRHIPDDYDVIQFGGFTVDHRINEITALRNRNQNGFVFKHYIKHPNLGIWNATMYALSRKGMEFYLACMDKVFWVADGPLYIAPMNHKLINTYITVVPIVIQISHNDTQSDIRNSENDNIDYDKDNLYESGIDKNNYYSFTK